MDVCMKVFDSNIYVYMIRVFSKKEYRDDFIRGHMYLNESGYFNKLEDSFRGDKYDSKIVEYNATIFINGHEFHPDIMTQGFVGDGKVPILCMTILNEEALVRTHNNKFKLKQSVVDELSQFGEYGLLFYYGELRENLEKYAKAHDWFIDQDVVTYVDAKKNKEYLNLYFHDRFKKYFVKDITYINQNETRLIFLNKSNPFIPLVSQENNHIEFDIDPLLSYYEFDIKKNIEMEFKKTTK